MTKSSSSSNKSHKKKKSSKEHKHERKRLREAGKLSAVRDTSHALSILSNESVTSAASDLSSYANENGNASAGSTVAAVLKSFPEVLNQGPFADLTPDEQNMLLQTLAQEAQNLVSPTEAPISPSDALLTDSRAANPKRRKIESVKYSRTSASASGQTTPRSETPAPTPSQNPKPVVMVSAVDVVGDDRTLSKMYRSRINKDDIGAERNTFNKGPFSRLERERIETAVMSFIEERNISREDLPLLVNRKSKMGIEGAINPYKGKEYAGFIAAVREQSAVNRSLDQLYWYLSRAYSPHRTEGRRWTEDDDVLLLALVAQKGRKWKEIEMEMGMTDAKSRYAKLNRGSAGINVGKWTAEEESSLIETVQELMAEKGIQNPTQFSSWKEVSLRLTTRTAHQCRTKWISDMVLRIDNGNQNRAATWRYEDDADMLTRLMTDCSTANDETEILWEALVPSTKIWTGPFLRNQWLKLRARIPDIESLSFQDAVQYAMTHLDQITTGVSRNDLVQSDEE